LGAPNEGEIEGVGSLERHRGWQCRSTGEDDGIDALCDMVPLDMMPMIVKKDTAKVA
jgi:hypothetical protein